jgi:hypothetical protein
VGRAEGHLPAAASGLARGLAQSVRPAAPRGTAPRRPSLPRHCRLRPYLVEPPPRHGMGMGKGRGMGMGMGRVWNGKAGQGMDKAGLGKGSDRRSDSQQLTSRTDQQTRVRA